MSVWCGQGHVWRGRKSLALLLSCWELCGASEMGGVRSPRTGLSGLRLVARGTWFPSQGDKNIQMADHSFSDGVPSDSVEAAKNASNTEKLTDQVMQNPRVLAALQERLDNVPHTPSSYIETLPKAVKRRINALKQLQVRCAHIEAKFYEEVHDLERKYAALYQPLFDKRREFITGDVEPTDAESEWHSENEEEEKLAGDMKNKVVITEKEAATAEEPNPKGIPEFWFTIFRNVDMLSELVQEYDEPILKHLQDIKVKFSDPGQPMSFVLEFHFEPNDYFTNSVLTKTYKMKSEPDKADPFSFEGPEIVDCDGLFCSLGCLEQQRQLLLPWEAADHLLCIVQT
ncbi:nucleosome assembly protein 1-like 4 isoform X5 [Trachypithecus francoisi]|uniref:nucleosome assembly protein 1-like 4 isoform X5 n=1 Tax=Trachypithecus francoisi TaxID=54180 RepID=UPI00141B91C2|nr:nucleosome assembly protein 1-like 4 isoform X5 [Trachypithecus francoisi]